MEIYLEWTEVTTYRQKVSVEDDTLAKMKDGGVDVTDPAEVFSYLESEGELDGEEVDSGSMEFERGKFLS